MTDGWTCIDTVIGLTIDRSQTEAWPHLSRGWGRWKVLLGGVWRRLLTILHRARRACRLGRRLPTKTASSFTGRNKQCSHEHEQKPWSRMVRSKLSRRLTMLH